MVLHGTRATRHLSDGFIDGGRVTVAFLVTRQTCRPSRGRIGSAIVRPAQACAFAWNPPPTPVHLHCMYVCVLYHLLGEFVAYRLRPAGDD